MSILGNNVYICMKFKTTQILGKIIKGMKKIGLLLLMGMVLLASCQDFDYGLEATTTTDNSEEELYHASLLFGVKINADQDWNTTVSGKVSITADADLEDIVKVQILTGSPFGSKANDTQVLNEVEAKKGETVTLTYDAPLRYERLYAACVSSQDIYYIKGFDVGQESVSFDDALTTRRTSGGYAEVVAELPPNPVIGRIEKSYSNQRGWKGWENDYLYRLADADEQIQALVLENYSQEYIKDLRTILFDYLPNKVSNIEQIRESQYYNENSYVITTGLNPIIIAPIYKNDGTSNEVNNCHMYYYYFKESDLEGMSESEQVQYLKNLPKYECVPIFRSVRNKYQSTGMTNDVIKRNTGYTLIYWGDNPKPTLGTVGSYQFPEGYKIGFMIRGGANDGKNAQKSGEMYADGRLNTDINQYGHYANAKLDPTDSRMAWICANNRHYLCCETGVDRDINDVVFEIEGGVEQMLTKGVIKGYQIYTFCFEDRDAPECDYDMNDVVVKAIRISSTQVLYSLEACGGTDRVYLRNIHGKILNEETELHKLFNANATVNVLGQERIAPVQEVVTVDPTFTFKDINKQVAIYNATTQKPIICLSGQGESPKAIMLPSDFQYPKEGVNIQNAYPGILGWLTNRFYNLSWFDENMVEDNVFNSDFYIMDGVLE